MKTVRWHPKHGDILHIETEGGIINIHPGLHDEDGNPVTHISVSAEYDRIPGDIWEAKYGVQDKSGTGIRLVKTRHARTR